MSNLNLITVDEPGHLYFLLKGPNACSRVNGMDSKHRMLSVKAFIPFLSDGFQPVSFNAPFMNIYHYNEKTTHLQLIVHLSLCQPFLGALITPVNPALYFCTLLRLPRDIRRLVSYSSGFVLQTKNQTG